MRLRYLHLPRYGPLNDTAIVFGREDLIAETLDLLPRSGSLNFVVGVNGSGKSFLLRAIYGVFRALMNREWPALPVTVAWDRTIGNTALTSLLRYTGKKSDTLFATFKLVPGNGSRNDWAEIIACLSSGQPNRLIEGRELVTGPGLLSSPMLFAHLPKRLIAYTSGAGDPWDNIESPLFHPRDEEEGQHRAEDERPQGWSLERELAEQISPPDAIFKKVLTNRILHSDGSEEAGFCVHPQELRLAGIILGLWQAARELKDRAEERQRETLRKTLLHQRDTDEKPKDARRVLNEIDWFWPTHLSLTYRDVEDRTTPRQHRELYCLVALADEVMAQPLGRQRVVLSIGPSDRISLSGKIQERIADKEIEDVAGRVDGCKTGAEAFLRIFSADDEIDSTPMDVFARLKDWARTGLLEDITLTVKRLHRSGNGDEETDDIIVTYDQLSDGEQMLLGRMGLIFLLRGQDGSLLLLDEPETHFNDVWKREVVEMIDMGLLNTTSANVIVATHTSIALTDAFAAEVTVLDRNKGKITAHSVTGGLFGTDPGEVTMNLFRSESSIGRRSAELLERLLKTEWEGRENELEAILNVLGSSFHRAELRAVLKQLRGRKDGSASS
jgi:energy-coupling factor transporter ATP-binding protein EcfA2